MNQQIFAYCERGIDGAFWAEPLNAISNLGFVVAGLVAVGLNLRERRRDRGLDPVPLLLAVLVIVIGIGSFLFHTLATRWAALADTVPIGVFMIVYFAFAVSRYLGLGLGAATAVTMGFAALIFAAQTVRCEGGSCLNGSVGYLPALAAMLVIGARLVFKRAGVARFVFGAAMVFAVSLTFRTLDRSLCDTVQPFGAPIGTHFLWHLLNAVTLYLLLLAALRHRQRDGA